MRSAIESAGRSVKSTVRRELRRLLPSSNTPGGAFLCTPSPEQTQELSRSLARTSPVATKLLRVGVRSEADVARVVDAASKAGLHTQPSLPTGGVYHSRTQQEIYEVLFSVGSTLAAGAYRSKGTIASMTLFGPRGMGKSTAMNAFATIAPLFLPDLIPVYVNYIGLDDPASHGYMRHNSVLVMVADALAVHGIYASPTQDGIVAALERHNKYVLLLLDEVDKLYESQGDVRVDSSNPSLRFAVERQTLGQLASLGDDPRGRLAVLLCGSSSLLGDLITTNLRSVNGSVVDYPVLQVAPNLNGQKFRAHRLVYSPPTDRSAMISMLQRPFIYAVDLNTQTRSRPKFDSIVNSVLFCAGATPRFVDRMITPKVPLTHSQLLGLFVDESPQASQTLKRPASRELWDAIMKALYDSNENLLNCLTTRGVVDYDAVASGEWCSRFNPLQWTDVLTIGRSVPTVGDVEFETFRFFDRGYIAFGDGVGSGNPVAVYPYTVMKLLLKRGRTIQKLTTEVLDPLVRGLNTLRSSSGTGSGSGSGDNLNSSAKSLRDGALREAGKDFYQMVKQQAMSLRDKAIELS